MEMKLEVLKIVDRGGSVNKVAADLMSNGLRYSSGRKRDWRLSHGVRKVLHGNTERKKNNEKC